MAAIDGTMPATERAATIAAFKRGELRALVSMNVLTTGFDAPAVDLIALCRPTLSPGLHVQMIGRGTRLSPATGKTDCLVLDFARNCLRHGPLDLIDGSDLGKSRGGGEAPAKACPACSTIVATATRICADCGFTFQFVPKETKLTTSPHAARLLSTDTEVPAGDWREVLGGTYKRHERDGRPPILQINYLVANRTIPISEWLAFEGPNETARRIARAKWRDRAGTQPPETTADAIGRTRELPKPKAIRVTPSAKNPNYLEVKAVSFEPRRAAA